MAFLKEPPHTHGSVGSSAVVLVKTQFEVGRAQVGKGGIVDDPAQHQQALRDVAASAGGLGYAGRDACASPVTGATGNREVFQHLAPEAARLAADALDKVLGKAVSP